ncbi:hypothetical protein NBRC116188_09560 [Oceaniserpentilla sp. 4NH20-0058]
MTLGNKHLTGFINNNSNNLQLIDFKGFFKVGTPNALLQTHNDIITNKNKKDESCVTLNMTQTTIKKFNQCYGPK